MRIKRGLVDVGFIKLPDQWVGSLGNVKRQAARFGAAKAAVVWQVGLDDFQIILGAAGEGSCEMDHSSSIVPGGFEVMS